NPNTETNITFTFGNTTMINKTTYNVTRERNFTFSSLNTNSVYSYNVTITDNASIENTTSTTRFITLDTTNPAPTLTSSQGTSFGEGGTTTLTCSVTDTNPSTLSLKEGTTTLCSASGTTTSCTTDITPSPGTHTYTCEPFDKASNTATTTLTLDISARSSSGGGSSGGGGGGSTRTIVPKSGDTEEKVTLEIKTEDTPVTTVTLEGTTEGSSLSEADVEIKSKSSNEITNKPDTPVYKYFTIEKKNFENNDLKQATIEFHVEENWINQQDKQPEDVALLHLEGENWKQYDAELLRSENGNYYYKSIVPGFSTFAIALKEEQEITQEEQTAPSVAEELTQSPQKKKWTIPVIFLLALTLATTIIYVIKQNKTK
ncbi:MAG: PGF-pre-PGF domain-containing protein, partial [Candidatus Nanoarchaeia archaeon]